MADLISTYEQLAQAFLESNVEGRLGAMRANFRYVPGDCDVLTTYIPVDNEAFIERMHSIVEDITASFPIGVPYYRVPPAAYHISLVMLHDVRPVQMNEEKFRESVLRGEAVGKAIEIIGDTIARAGIGQYELRVHGIRFSARDGTIMVVFVDDSDQTRSLRKVIDEALGSLLKRDALLWGKTFVHLTLLRPLMQYPPELFRALQDKQLQYRDLAQQDLRIPVRKIELGREVRWMHAKVEPIRTFSLV